MVKDSEDLGLACFEVCPEDSIVESVDGEYTLVVRKGSPIEIKAHSSWFDRQLHVELELNLGGEA